MEALEVQDVSKIANSSESIVSIDSLSELTGFPIEFIKRELLIEGDRDEDMSLEELRKRVLVYLDSNF